MRMKAKCVRETIAAIEAATDTPELIRIKQGWPRPVLSIRRGLERMEWLCHDRIPATRRRHIFVHDAASRDI